MCIICVCYVQTICDGVKLYWGKVFDILESNGYYDYIDNQQFDVTDQVAITAGVY